MAQRAWDQVEQTPESVAERRRVEASFLADRTSFPSDAAPATLTEGEALLLDMLLDRHIEVIRYLADKQVVWYPSILDINQVHVETMRRGGYPPQDLVRLDALESAIHRPLNVARYEGGDLADQAVALGMGVALAHAYTDGNKRTAYMSLQMFLARNGLLLVDDAFVLADLLVEAVAADGRDGSRDAVVARIADHIRTHAHRFISPTPQVLGCDGWCCPASKGHG